VPKSRGRLHKVDRVLVRFPDFGFSEKGHAFFKYELFAALVDSGFRNRPCDLVVERFNYSEFIDD
jgi:hypothetical protein